MSELIRETKAWTIAAVLCHPPRPPPASASLAALQVDQQPVCTTWRRGDGRPLTFSSKCGRHGTAHCNDCAPLNWAPEVWTARALCGQGLPMDRTDGSANLQPTTSITSAQNTGTRATTWVLDVCCSMFYSVVLMAGCPRCSCRLSFQFTCPRSKGRKGTNSSLRVHAGFALSADA